MQMQMQRAEQQSTEEVSQSHLSILLSMVQVGAGAQGEDAGWTESQPVSRESVQSSASQQQQQATSSMSPLQRSVQRSNQLTISTGKGGGDGGEQVVSGSYSDGECCPSRYPGIYYGEGC